MENIVNALNKCKHCGLKKVIEEYHVKVDEFKFDSAYGAILIGESTFIFLDSELGEMKEFVMWHELGHLFLEGKGLFCFTKIYDEKELKANAFACLMMGKNEVEWINKGCPPDIAKEVDCYISQNVCVCREVLKYYDMEVVSYA